MASTSLRLLLIAFLLALSPSVVWADAILLGDNRVISGSANAFGATSGNSDNYSEAAVFGSPFSASDSASAAFGTASATASSNQSSTVGPLEFFFQGTALSSSISDPAVNGAGGNGISTYIADFRLLEPHTYSFDVTSVANQLGGADSQSVSFASLGFLGSSVFLHQLTVFSGTDSLNASGTLAPGDYQVLFQAFSRSDTVPPDFFTASGQSTVIGNLTLAPDGQPPIPEPTSILLVTSGLVGMGVRQWRKRRPKD